MFRTFGVVDEAAKEQLLHAADVALNPMFGGSGTAVKMFDYMAAGLPVISTAVGARGIVDNGSAGVVVVPGSDICAKIEALLADGEWRRDLGERNRRVVEDQFSWERISAKPGRLLQESWTQKQDPEDIGALQPRPVSEAATNRIALLSTWNIRCGIAEYSGAFAAALRRRGTAVLWLANARSGGASQAGLRRDEEVAFTWDYDSEHFREGTVHLSTTVELLRRRAIKHVSIQYHPGFYPVAQLRAFVSACKTHGISTCVTMHNSKLVSFDDLRTLGDATSLLSLSDDERVRLGNAGIVVDYLPHGVEDLPLEQRLGLRAGSPVVGTFGFIRAHKGLLPLIQAVGHLSARIPELSLKMYTAIYPSEDSRVYHRHCRELISRLGLTERIELMTDFLPSAELTKKLHACDLVVLPYEPSDEGTSGAACTVVAASCPIAASSSGIFNEIRDVVHTLDSCEPQAMARELGNLLGNRERLDQLADAAARYVKRASWDSVALRYLERFVSADHRVVRTSTASGEVEAPAVAVALQE